MKRNAGSALVTMLAVVTMASALGLTGSAQSRLQGVWRITEVADDPAKPTAPFSQPGLYLFTQKYFSIVAVASNTARPTIADSTHVTGDEALAVWGPFMAQSGEYELTPAALTVRPLVAKNPGMMRLE